MPALVSPNSHGIAIPQVGIVGDGLSVDGSKSSRPRTEGLDMVLESILRRKLTRHPAPKDNGFPAVDIRVSLACSAEEQSAADRFVATRYAWRGYLTDSGSGPQATEASPVLNSFTLLAYHTDKIVGTLTVGVDSSNGMLVDKENRNVVDRLRRTGRRVVELRRLAARDSGEAKAVLAHLFGAAYLVGRVLHDATDVLIEVNPRHAAFYRRIFGFVLVREEWLCTRVNAPAVLLHLDIANLDRKLGRGAHGSDALEPAAAWSLCGFSGNSPFSSPLDAEASPRLGCVPGTSACPYVDASGCCKMWMTR